MSVPPDRPAAATSSASLTLSRRTMLVASTISAMGMAFIPDAVAAASTAIHYVRTPHGRLAYAIDGERRGRPPLLLLQRFRGTISDWDPQFVALACRHRQVIRFDSAGIGRSDGKPVDSIEEMASVAAELMEALGIARADVLGWSLGGYVAQELALRSPDRVRRLIVAAAGPGALSEVPSTDPRYIQIAGKPTNGDDDYLTLFFSDDEVGRAAGRAYLARLKSQPDTGPAPTMAVAQAQGMAMGRWPGARARLARLTVSVLAANGVHDVLMPPFGTYVIAKEAPDAKAILYPGAGHAFLFQYAAEFTTEVDRFLDA